MKLLNIWKRIVKQPISLTRDKDAVVIIDGKEYKIEKIKYENGQMVGFEILEKIEGESRWISVYDRLPTREECWKNDGRFIVTNGQRVYQRHYFPELPYFFEPEPFRKEEDTYDRCVVGWQEMPEADINLVYM